MVAHFLHNRIMLEQSIAGKRCVVKTMCGTLILML